MNKKFLSAILFGALMVSSTGTFVSCKDYDDDITELWDAVNGQKTDLTAKVTAVESSIANLTSAQTALETKIAETQDAAQKAADAAQAAAIKAAKEELEAVKAELEATISKLSSDNQEAVDAVKEDVKELEATIAEVAGKVRALQAFQSTTEKTLEELAQADATLTSSLTALDEKVTANATAIGKNKVAIDAQIEALNNYKTSNDEAVSANKAAIEAVVEKLNKHQEVLDKLNAFDVEETQTALEDLTEETQKISEEITKINNNLEVLSAAIYKGVTHVSLIASDKVYANTNLELLSAEAVRTWTFGENLPGAIVFEKGKRATFTESFLIRVSPTDAVISAENIKLINSQGADLEGLVSVKEVKAYDGLLTRGISANGLWEVSVEMNKDYDEDAFIAATQKENEDKTTSQILYAVSLNTTLSEGENKAYSRSVVSEYNLTFGTDEKAAQNKLSFKVDKEDVDGIANRFDIKNDYTWKDGKVAAEPIFDEKNANYNVAVDASDIRNNLKAYPVTLSKAFTVSIDDDKVKGFYVAIDYDRVSTADDSSEKVAWKKYEPSIKGLNTVTETGSIDLTITDADALTDYICFRVYAVNHDGSLVDPDGKAFEVVVGEAPEELNTYATTWTKVYNESKGSVEEFKPAEVAEGVFGDWYDPTEVRIRQASVDTVMYGSDVKDAIAITGLKFLKNDKKTETSTAKDIKFVQVVNNVDSKYYDNGKTYSAVYEFVNKRNQVLKTMTVSLTKVMPEFPAEVKPFNNILQGGTLLKIYPKDIQNNAFAAYNMNNVWHGLNLWTAFTQVLAEDEERPVVNYLNGTVKAPKAIMNPEADEFETKYPMVASYTYMQFNDTEIDGYYNWVVEGTKFDLVFGNYVYDCTFDWTKEKPVLTYPGVVGTKQTIAVDKLTGKDWYGKAVYLYDEQTLANKFKAFNEYGTIESVEVITGNGDVNEYYTAKLVDPTYKNNNTVDVPAHIELTANSTASQGDNVETIIRLKIKDIYGFTVVKDLPSFTMTFTSNK